MEERCNNFLDCKDGSDEDSCETLIIDQISYRKRMPPISKQAQPSWKERVVTASLIIGAALLCGSVACLGGTRTLKQLFGAIGYATTP